MEYDRQPNGQLGALGLQIKKKRFESYNSAWVDFVGPEASSSLDPAIALGPSAMGMGLGSASGAPSYDDDLVSLGPSSGFYPDKKVN